MKRLNAKGFALAAILLPIILIVIAALGYFVYSSQLSAKDKKTKKSLGFAVQSIYYKATATQTSPATLQEADSKIDSSLGYTKLGDSDYLLCASFHRAGGDSVTPWVTLSNLPSSVTVEQGVTYWDFTGNGPYDSVKYVKGKNCYYTELKSVDGFVNKSGTICDTTYNWRYENRKVVSYTGSVGLETILTTDPDHPGLEKTFYVDSNGGKVVDKNCKAIPITSIPQGSLATFYFTKNSEVYAKFVQIN